MNRTLLAALALVSLAACSQKTQDESADAANSAAADVGATTRNAVSDVQAASDAALSSAAVKLDQAGKKLDRAGDRLDRAADRAADATGAALSNAGDAIRNQ